MSRSYTRSHRIPRQQRPRLSMLVTMGLLHRMAYWAAQSIGEAAPIARKVVAATTATATVPHALFAAVDATGRCLAVGVRPSQPAEFYVVETVDFLPSNASETR